MAILWVAVKFLAYKKKKRTPVHAISQSVTRPGSQLLHWNVPLQWRTNAERVISKRFVLTGCCYGDGHVRGRGDPPHSTAQTATNRAFSVSRPLSYHQTEPSSTHKQSHYYFLVAYFCLSFYVLSAAPFIYNIPLSFLTPSICHWAPPLRPLYVRKRLL
jgi:hypothetical protein